MEVRKDDFDAFTEWLKKDGLVPRKSERLWKKKIFANLLNNDARTIANYNDFCHDKKIKKMLNMRLSYEHIDSIIVKVELSDSQYFITTLDNHQLIVNCAEIDSFFKVINHE